MMRHDPRFVTFFSAYLNEIAKFDLQNAFLEEEKQDQLFRMFAHVSLTRDPRAVRDMVPEEVWANTPPDPDIVALEEERATLKQGQYRIDGLEHEGRIRELTEEIRTKRAERERRIIKGYREYYFYQRPTWDIEAQARGEVEEDIVEPTIDLAIPERARLAQILCCQPDSWTAEETIQRRIEAIGLWVALCDKKETGNRAHARLGTQIGQSSKPESHQPAVAQREPEPGPGLFPLLLEPRQCPDCIGDEQLPLEERTFQWCRPPVRNDHFDDRHLMERERAQKHGEPIECRHPQCRDEKFKHLDHFRGHVKVVHGIVLRSTEQVNRRRLQKIRHRQLAGRKNLEN